VSEERSKRVRWGRSRAVSKLAVGEVTPSVAASTRVAIVRRSTRRLFGCGNYKRERGVE